MSGLVLNSGVLAAVEPDYCLANEDPDQPDRIAQFEPRTDNIPDAATICERKDFTIHNASKIQWGYDNEMTAEQEELKNWIWDHEKLLKAKGYYPNKSITNLKNFVVASNNDVAFVSYISGDLKPLFMHEFTKISIFTGCLCISVMVIVLLIRFKLKKHSQE